MKRIAASVTVALPADLCYRVAEQSYADERWRAAYASLRPGRSYSGHVTTRDPGRRLVIEIGTIDGMTGTQVPAAGYRITYTFSPDGQRTRVEIAVEYEMLLAVTALGMMEGQATNEVLHRLAAMVALEAGYEASVGASGMRLS
jgi:hypothetical protein